VGSATVQQDAVVPTSDRLLLDLQALALHGRVWTVDVLFQLTAVDASARDIAGGASSTPTATLAVNYMQCALRLTSAASFVRLYSLDENGALTSGSAQTATLPEPFLPPDIVRTRVTFSGDDVFCFTDGDTDGSAAGARWRRPSILIERRAAVIRAVTVYARD
jgi:hypothetical protein